MKKFILSFDYSYITSFYSKLAVNCNTICYNSQPNLYVKDFSQSRLHTFILLDDSAFLLRNENSIWNKWLCQLRHLNFTVFMCLQIWKSIITSIKSQISSIHLFRGFSRQQVNYIYQQISLDMEFNDLWRLYVSIPKNKKLIIDLIDMTINID